MIRELDHLGQIFLSIADQPLIQIHDSEVFY